MFKDNSIQYVNIKKYDKQLKIDNQILKNDKIIKTNHSSFLIDNNLSKDSISKLNILQIDVKKTYLTTVCESHNQQVVKSDEFFEEDYVIRKLNTSHSVAILKDDLEDQKGYFKDTGIDYIFSPFNILYNHTMSNGANTNSVNILILNNTVYAIILNDEKRIAHSCIKTLTAFDDIQNSEFYDDSLDGQKLFDEVHLLEIQDVITSITTEFYELNESDSFCKNVSIFYTVKQLNDEQVNTLTETLMLEVEYSTVNFDEYLYSFAKQTNATKNSFIQPREKKSGTSAITWLVGLFISFALVAGIFVYLQEQEKLKQIQLEKERIEKIEAQKRAEAAKVKLPNHIAKNDQITSIILSIFDIIPYNAVLDELQLQKNDSTFVFNFLNKDTLTKDVQPKLLKLYKTSEVLLLQHNKPTYNAIIANSTLLPQKSSTKQIQPKYKEGKFLSQKEVAKQIKAFLPKDSEVNFKSKFKSKLLTYNFEVKTILKTPQEFFNFVEELNKKSESKHIRYPIEFAKTTKGLETKFNLQFHQFKKKK